ncbi:MAG TPA: N,N-dimethylformamidase beta subunit family domain-containing protein [Caulobacteraceae bacterium]
MKAAPSPVAWTAWFKGQRLWAYADRISFEPGEPLCLMIAGGPGQPHRRVRAEVFRIGAGDPKLVWTSEFVDVGYIGATGSGASIGPGWPPALGPIETRAWPPGCYSCDLVEQTTATRDVRACQWIVKNPRRSGAVLLRLGTNTYQAYNDWGGHSLYPNGDDERRGLMVSFDRPTPPAFFEYDGWLVQWLEGLSVSLGGVDYASNFDIHANPAFMDPYPLVITGAHDEYWSGEEFEAFQRRIFSQGRNTGFFGANTAYCQIRYADLNASRGAAPLGRQIVCYKTSDDPIARRAGKLDPALLVTSNFRTNARRPETMLMGGAYQNWFDAGNDQRPALVVARTDLPFFEGTGWKVGDVAANVVGYEWDNRDPDGDGKRLWDAARSHIPPIDPAAIKVLFRGQAIDSEGHPGMAESTYFVSKAGAKVFNAASVRWAWGLGKPGFDNPAFTRFNENLVRALSRR